MLPSRWIYDCTSLFGIKTPFDILNIFTYSTQKQMKEGEPGKGLSLAMAHSFNEKLLLIDTADA